MSVTDFTVHVGISRIMLSQLLHGHAGFSADMDLHF